MYETYAERAGLPRAEVSYEFCRAIVRPDITNIKEPDDGDRDGEQMDEGDGGRTRVPYKET